MMSSSNRRKLRSSRRFVGVNAGAVSSAKRTSTPSRQSQRGRLRQWLQRKELSLNSRPDKRSPTHQSSFSRWSAADTIMTTTSRATQLRFSRRTTTKRQRRQRSTKRSLTCRKRLRRAQRPSSKLRQLKALTSTYRRPPLHPTARSKTSSNVSAPSHNVSLSQAN